MLSYFHKISIKYCRAMETKELELKTPEDNSAKKEAKEQMLYRFPVCPLNEDYIQALGNILTGIVNEFKEEYETINAKISSISHSEVRQGAIEAGELSEYRKIMNRFTLMLDKIYLRMKKKALIQNMKQIAEQAKNRAKAVTILKVVMVKHIKRKNRRALRLLSKHAKMIKKSTAINHAKVKKKVLNSFKRLISLRKMLESRADIRRNIHLASKLSLIHICRCRRYAVCRSRWSP
eukprot:TRINITY_DN22568_c0_g1_i2.p1 TRINITY_DN22568_c0_g1~~TRINITY_DN22568_c0_g1_i2.p1  ORF type:complete len:235 (+),score=34.30 TRINITY_DN22568_c0_g1_i2:173-877(+)